MSEDLFPLAACLRSDAVTFEASTDSRECQALPFTLQTYARGYLYAAERLAFVEDPPPELIYPVAYLWRHYFELALKTLHGWLPAPQVGLRLFERRRGAEVSKSHDLRQLWSALHPHLAQLRPDRADDLAAAAELIETLATVDPDGDAFRYPTDPRPKKAARRDDAPVPKVVLLPRGADLAEWSRTMRYLAEFLDGVARMLAQAYEQTGRQGWRAVGRAPASRTDVWARNARSRRAEGDARVSSGHRTVSGRTVRLWSLEPPRSAEASES